MELPLLALQQQIVMGGIGGYSLIVLGAVLLILGIVLGHFFPSKYWIALIAAGIVLLIIGVVLLVL